MNSCIISGCSIYLLHRWQLCFFCLMLSMLSYLLSHHNKEVSLLIYQKLVLKRCLSLEVISQQCQSEDQSEVSYRGLYPIQEWNLLRAHLQLIITQWMAILTKKRLDLSVSIIKTIHTSSPILFVTEYEAFRENSAE